MDITITINTDSADLSHFCETEDCDYNYNHMPLSAMLLRIAQQVRRGKHNDPGKRPIRDINGNTVGHFEVRE